MFCNAPYSNGIWINKVLLAYLSFYQYIMVICLSAIALSYCVTCYWKLLPVVFVVSLHHKALLSYGAKCYFSKLGDHLFLLQCFWRKFLDFFLIFGPKNVICFENGSDASLSSIQYAQVDCFYNIMG